jgi:hypothetical protein
MQSRTLPHFDCVVCGTSATLQDFPLVRTSPFGSEVPCGLMDRGQMTDSKCVTRPLSILFDGFAHTHQKR